MRAFDNGGVQHPSVMICIQSILIQWIVLGAMIAFVGKSSGQEPAPSATNVTYKITPGVVHEFVVPLTAAAKLGVTASKNPAVEVAKAAIAVPFGFDPAI